MHRGLSGRAVACAAVLLWAWGSARADGPAPAPARTIEVVAADFRFEPAVIEVMEGERVVLKVRSTDGRKHGIAIKEFGAKAEVPKTGEVVSLDFVAARAGTYSITCSVYCGSGHSRMKGRLVVARAAR